MRTTSHRATTSPLPDRTKWFRHRAPRTIGRCLLVLSLVLTVCVGCGCGSHYRILSPFGSRFGAHGGLRASPHRGVDFRAGIGDPVIAAASGRVVGRTFDENAGWMVVLEHSILPGCGEPTNVHLYTRYVHLRKVSISLDDCVLRGQVLGETGQFKLSGGAPHVHLELCLRRTCQDYPNGLQGV